MDIKDTKLKHCPLCGGEVSVASGSECRYYRAG